MTYFHETIYKQNILIMENINFDSHMWVVPIAALIPMILGFIWYHEKLFGKMWLAETGLTEEEAAGGNMIVRFILAFLFSCFMGIIVMSLVNHQLGLFQVFEGLEGLDVAGSAVNTEFNDLMAKYGDRHKGLGHGLLHGFLAGFLFAFPVIATNALFEQKGWKYILINGGYWITCITLMGGVFGYFG